MLQPSSPAIPHQSPWGYHHDPRVHITCNKFTRASTLDAHRCLFSGSQLDRLVRFDNGSTNHLLLLYLLSRDIGACVETREVETREACDIYISTEWFPSQLHSRVCIELLYMGWNAHCYCMTVYTYNTTTTLYAQHSRGVHYLGSACHTKHADD